MLVITRPPQDDTTTRIHMPGTTNVSIAFFAALRADFVLRLYTIRSHAFFPARGRLIRRNKMKLAQPNVRGHVCLFRVSIAKQVGGYSAPPF
jgi:hypothetical protein